MGRVAVKTRSNRRKTAADGLTVLKAASLTELEWVIHGFSTRTGGVSKAYGGNSLNLGVTEQDTAEAVERNREIFLKRLGAANGRKLWPTAPMHQIHSAVIHRVDAVAEKTLQGDGLITNVSGLLLTVRTADCVPVLLADGKKRVIGAFHAGWRGTLARIVEKGVGEMRRQFGSDPGDMVAAIGPCIHACCYEVSDDFREKFRTQFAYADDLFEEVFDSNSLHLKYPLLFLNQRAPGHGDAASKLHLNLVEANRRQLLDSGLAEKNIWMSELCTSCRTDVLFSHRAEFGQTGRMLAAIGIRG
ncbi:MAG TPA: peptidoglycan editing factor PgeF [Terriglobales bacterium]|nr:peptidoglycan editing factor PgeF [Terriglobales bacterium]